MITFYCERKKSKFKLNKRITIVTVTSIALTIIELLNSGTLSSFFSYKTYFFILVVYLSFLIFWIYNFIYKKKRDFLENALNKNLNFQEVFIYVILITLTFPFISDAVKLKSSFPFEFNARISSNYTSFSRLNSEITIYNKISIRNNTNKNHIVRVQTIASPVLTSAYLDSLIISKNYEQYITNSYHSVSNSNSISDVFLIEEKILMPNFIGGIMIDSLNKIFTGDTLIYYYNKFRFIRDHNLSKDKINNNSKFLFQYPDMGINYCIDHNWVSKISITEHFSGKTFVFFMSGTMRHDLNRLIKKKYLILSSGILQQSFVLLPYYIVNDKKKKIDKDILTVVFNENENIDKTVYKILGDASFHMGVENNNTFFVNEGFPIRIYIYSLNIRENNYDKRLCEYYDQIYK